MATTPLFQQHDSLYRLLRKACAADPADRFASADELRVQLLGVLREVVAARTPRAAAASTPRPRCCSRPPRSPTSRWTGATCRRCGSTTRDPQAGWLRTVSIDDPGAAARPAAVGAALVPEVLLATGRAALEAGRTDVVEAAVRDMLGADPWEWRAVWLSGLASLATDDAAGAQAAFNAVYGQVPGELAPKLALALACETSGELDVAESLYATCARTDANYIAPAAFGLARIRATRGDLDGELAALDLVPPTSRAFPRRGRQPGRAAGRLGPGNARPRRGDGQHRRPDHRATRARQPGRRRPAGGLTQVLADGPEPDISIAGRPAVEPALRDGLEAAYRDLAGHAPTRTERVAPGRPRQRRTTMESSMSTCPSCSTSVSDEERFCEACGRPRSGDGLAAPAGPDRDAAAGDGNGDAARHRATVEIPVAAPVCAACGGRLPRTATAARAARGRPPPRPRRRAARVLGGRRVRPRHPAPPQRGRGRRGRGPRAGYPRRARGLRRGLVLDRLRRGQPGRRPRRAGRARDLLPARRWAPPPRGSP